MRKKITEFEYRISEVIQLVTTSTFVIQA